MAVYISVGNTVVGAFDSLSDKRAVNCLRMIAPGCKPRTKKCPRQNELKRANNRSNEARRITNKLGSYKQYPRYLKPGEFSL